MNQALEWSRCNLCGKSNAQFLFKKYEVNIVRCKTCGLVYQSPQRKPQEEIGFYRKKAFVSESADRFVKKRAALFKYLLKEVSQREKKGKLLDIGCQFGYFLQLAKEKGWQTFGIEVSNRATAFAKEKLNLNVFAGTLKEANFPDEFFDAVTLWDVLYEIPDPAQELKEIRRILKKQGLISLRLGNADFHLAIHYFYEFFRGIFKIFKFRDAAVFHICEFSPIVIEKMLKKAGFRDIEVKNSVPTKGDLYSSFTYLNPIMIEVLKKTLFFFSSLLYYLSKKKVVFFSSMIVHARK